MIEHAHTNNSTLALARTVLSREAEALTNLADRLGDTFLKAVQCLLNCKGRVVVSGVGKSGHIGCKLAATLASTGTPAFFVHAGEAAHGDHRLAVAFERLVRNVEFDIQFRKLFCKDLARDVENDRSALPA